MAEQEEPKKPSKADKLRADVRSEFDQHAARLAKLEQAKPPSMIEIMAMFASMQAEIDGLKGEVAQLTVTRPRELGADEAEQLMLDKPNTRFLVVAGGNTSLKPGDIIDARNRFQSARHLAQHVASGLRIAVAGG